MASNRSSADTTQTVFKIGPDNDCLYCGYSGVRGHTCATCDPGRDWSGLDVTQAAFFLLDRHWHLGHIQWTTPNRFSQVLYDETVRAVSSAITDHAEGFERQREYVPPKPSTDDGPTQVTLTEVHDR